MAGEKIRDIVESLPEDKKKQLDALLKTGEGGILEEMGVSMEITFRVFDENGDLKQEEKVSC